MNFCELLEKIKIEPIMFEVKDEQLLCSVSGEGYRLPNELYLGIKTNKQNLINLLTQTPNSIQAFPTKCSRNDVVAFPLSYAQQALWLINQAQDPAEQIYNKVIPMRITGELCLDSLDKALQQVVARHAILRSCFTEHRSGVGAIEQIVRQSVDIKVNHIDPKVMTLPELINSEYLHTFDLKKTPLIRFQWRPEGLSKGVLLINCHHIIFDGWSINVLLNELNYFYKQYVHHDNVITPIPKLPLQFSDYAQWQSEWLSTSAAKKQINYWQKILTDAPPLLSMPTDRPRPSTYNYQGAKWTLDIPKTIVEQVKQVSQHLGVTPFVIYFSGLNILLASYSGERDIIVGASVANRTQQSLESLIGFFVNNLPVRAQLSMVDSVVQAILTTKQAVLGAFEHKELPFEKMVEAIKPIKNSDYNPFFQVLFVMQNMPLKELALDNSKIDFVLSDEICWAKFDMTIQLLEGVEGTAVQCEYATALFDQQTINTFLRDYIRLLASFSDALEQPLLSLMASTHSPRAIKLSHGYSNHKAAYEHWLTGPVLYEHLDYWHTELNAAPVLLELPTYYPRLIEPSYQAGQWRSVLDEHTVEQLATLSRSQNATLFMSLFSAFNLFLARYSGQSDICVGSPVVVQNGSETTPFINTLVIRNQIELTNSFVVFLSQVKQTALLAHEYQRLPIEQLVEALEINKNTSHHPLFQVVFAQRDDALLQAQSFTSNGTKLIHKTLFDLALEVAEENDELVCYWEYRADLFTPQQVGCMAAYFNQLLLKIIEFPNVPMQELFLLLVNKDHKNSDQEEFHL